MVKTASLTVGGEITLPESLPVHSTVLTQDQSWPQQPAAARQGASVTQQRAPETMLWAESPPTSIQN